MHRGCTGTTRCTGGLTLRAGHLRHLLPLYVLFAPLQPSDSDCGTTLLVAAPAPCSVMRVHFTRAATAMMNVHDLTRRKIEVLVLNIFAVISVLLLAAAPANAQSRHYLNCASTTTGDSLRPESAWNSLDQANAYEFHPGDALLISRGSTCRGMLMPRGSGTPNRPIAIDAYGAGPLPMLIGTGNPAALKLDDQQYWNIAHLELTGGNPYGLFITGASPSLTHFHLSNLVAHDVKGTPKSKETGLIVIGAKPDAVTLFHDVLIDGVTAYSSTQWAGIVVKAGTFNKSGAIRGSDVMIRNSVVHDVAGDGILLMLAKNGRLERNVVWNTGMESSYSIGTPDGIWEWMCEDCLVQYNEGFFTDSPGVDGGVFDIDFGNINNTVQYNFGHDSQGYCVSVFGAEGTPGISRNSIVRGNLCLENGRSPREAQRQGAIYLSTWDGGKLSGVQIYGNTVLWDPPVETAAIVSDAEVDPAEPRMVHNNLILSRTGPLVQSKGGLQFADNQYWISTEASPSWQIDGTAYGSLEQVQAGGYEKGSVIAEARTNTLYQPASAPKSCGATTALQHDIFGRPMTACSGAVAVAGPTQPNPAQTLASLALRYAGKPFTPRGWTLLAKLTPEGKPQAADSRSQMVVLQSMKKQFGPLGLQIVVVPDSSLALEAQSNWRADWNFGEIKLVETTEASSTLGLSESPGMLLFNPAGQAVDAWDGLTAAPEVELRLRSLLGAPIGMQALPPLSTFPVDGRTP